MGRQDGQAPIDLECIRPDNLASKHPGKSKGEIRFAGPRGAGNKECFRWKHGNVKGRRLGCRSLGIAGGFRMLRGIAALGTFSAAFGNGLGTADH